MTFALETIGLDKQFGGLHVTRELSLKIAAGARQPLHPWAGGMLSRAAGLDLRILGAATAEREEQLGVLLDARP